ncbi:SAM-dependent methyltransferase [Aeromicrobium sp. UC242_57]|uniref:SAM-dependent methyltransferase n=1 Tax=Aeromicrobium sp. UC242_57 TaxID=3374624 RepID=UPI0037A52538
MTQPEYFEQMYESSRDPWALAERVYERRKYDVTMASLPRQTYRRAFEPGCSIGLLTARLMARCDDVVAIDPVTSPLVDAKLRAPDATFAQGAIPHDWPSGTFDLIVLSEVMYYLSAEDRRTTLRPRTSVARARRAPGLRPLASRLRGRSLQWRPGAPRDARTAGLDPRRRARGGGLPGGGVPT